MTVMRGWRQKGWPSGSGSVREHVQRLGRILRQREGKRAVLYEIVSAGTTETFTSDRRREHDAYR